MFESEDLVGPEAPEYLAKMAVVGLLQANALLSAACPNVLVFEGELLDDSAPDNIPKPFIRLFSKPGPSMWFSERQHKFQMQFMVELAVAGTRDRNLLKLWNMVRLALSPNGQSPDPTKTNLQCLQAGGIMNIEFSEAPYDVVNAGTGANRYLHSVGWFNALLLVNT